MNIVLSNGQPVVIGAVRRLYVTLKHSTSRSQCKVFLFPKSDAIMPAIYRQYGAEHWSATKETVTLRFRDISAYLRCLNGLSKELLPYHK